MSAHLDLDALADLLAGEGSERDVAHVAGCATCSAALVDLDAALVPVAAALAALPAPRVPDDLDARIREALASAGEVQPADVQPADVQPGDVQPAAGVSRAEPVALDDADEHPGPPRSLPTPLPARRPQRSRPAAAPWLLRAAAASAAVLVVGGGAFALSRADLSGSDDAASSAAASAGAPPSAASEAAPPAAPGVGRDDMPVPTSSTGTDYAATGTLAAALPALLRGGATAAAAPGRGPDPLARLRAPAELAGCLSALLPPARPLALDYATYAGAPALAVVRAGPSAGAFDVVLVGATCRAGDPAVLATRRVP